MDFMANGLLALGAAPAMVHSVDELEVVRISTKGLVYDVSLEKDSEPHKKYEQKHWKHDSFFFGLPKRPREKLQYTSIPFMKFLFEKGAVSRVCVFRFRSL